MEAGLIEPTCFGVGQTLNNKSGHGGGGDGGGLTHSQKGAGEMLREPKMGRCSFSLLKTNPGRAPAGRAIF